jgi:sodium transport system ATP-binding protein
MINVASLSKSFTLTKYWYMKKRFDAVKDLSFSVSPGSIYALLGPNGSGKTTTFRCIAALYKPSVGSVSVMGHDTRKETQAARSAIGFLSSDIKLSGHQSCREVLELYGLLNRMDEEALEARMEYLADFFDLRAFWKRPIEKYSSGQRQRAALAVSVIHDPPALLFDEPTIGLDVLAAKAVWDFLLEGKKRGKTILLSTHSIDEAEKVSDRIGLILSGSLSLEGSPAELREKLQTDSLENAFYDLIKADKASREAIHA